LVLITAARVGTDRPAKQGSSSFLKKRTKRLLLCRLMRLIRLARIETSKSFLVLFFKKELLSWRLPSLAVSRSQRGPVPTSGHNALQREPGRGFRQGAF
jgi:hypothetical protein